MKYLYVLLFSVASNFVLATYHEGDSGTGGSSNDGGGYGSSSSYAGALIGAGLIAYFVLNNNDEEESSEFVDKQQQSKFSIDFLRDEKSNNIFSNFEGKINSEQNIEYQINFRYYLN